MYCSSHPAESDVAIRAKVTSMSVDYIQPTLVEAELSLTSRVQEYRNIVSTKYTLNKRSKYLDKNVSRGAHSLVMGHPRGSRVSISRNIVIACPLVCLIVTVANDIKKFTCMLNWLLTVGDKNSPTYDAVYHKTQLSQTTRVQLYIEFAE